MVRSVMIVDDELGLAAAIETFLKRQGVEARSFPTAEAGLTALGELAPDVALVDLQLPGMDGLAALAAIKRERPETVVVVMTGYTSVQGAVAAMRQGAFDYVAKPLDLDDLWLVIQRAWDAERARGELAYLRQRAGHSAPVASLLGTSAAMEAVRQRILQVAAADRRGDAGPTVLVTGETGTGKQLAAHAIHAAGPRASGPFIEINCAAIPSALLEGELFGFERGAYTDARASKPGLFEAADGGTLLLDEIGLLDVALQAKLLKVIEDRAVRRLGAVTSRRVDVRIVAATNRDLEPAVREGTFRADLLYRLRVLTVEMPPLRGRTEDIWLLAQHALDRVRERYGLSGTHWAPAAREVLVAYPWPGNVRELTHVVERAALLHPGRALGSETLGLGPPQGTAVSVGPDGVVVDYSQGSIELEAVERSLIDQALRHAGWNRARAAELLGLTRETLRYRIEKFRLAPEREAE
jgi:two-component system, NtrC family, response regulator AtoC